MLEVAADSDAFRIDAECGANGIGEFVTEGNFVVHPGADFANALPTLRRVAEEFGGGVGQQVHFAVTAIHQVGKDIVGKMLHVIFLGVEAFDIGQAGIFDERRIVQADFAGRHDEATTIVAESVVIIFDAYHRIGFEEVRLT